MENDITLIANAGVLIRHRGIKILIDALHTKPTQRFSTPSEQMLDMIINGEGIFEGIDFLLITHGHLDHYNKDAVDAFVKTHPATRIITPTTDLDPSESITTITEKKGILSFGKTSISYRRLMHDGKKYADYPNYGFIVDIDGLKICLFGDATFDRPNVDKLIGKNQIDIALMNFPFVNLRRGHEMITEIVKPRRIIVFHLPYEKDDNSGFIQGTLRAASKASDLPPITVLYREMEQTKI